MRIKSSTDKIKAIETSYSREPRDRPGHEPPVYLTENLTEASRQTPLVHEHFRTTEPRDHPPPGQVFLPGSRLSPYTAKIHHTPPGYTGKKQRQREVREEPPPCSPQTLTDTTTIETNSKAWNFCPHCGQKISECECTDTDTEPEPEARAAVALRSLRVDERPNELPHMLPEAMLQLFPSNMCHEPLVREEYSRAMDRRRPKYGS